MSSQPLTELKLKVNTFPCRERIGVVIRSRRVAQSACERNTCQCRSSLRNQRGRCPPKKYFHNTGFRDAEDNNKKRSSLALGTPEQMRNEVFVASDFQRKQPTSTRAPPAACPALTSRLEMQAKRQHANRSDCTLRRLHRRPRPLPKKHTHTDCDTFAQLVRKLHGRPRKGI